MPNLYISTTLNPYENIGMEYDIFKSTEEEGLFLWVNQPSVILGRNQNIQAEVDQVYLKRNHILIARRLTGGGCVYHDEGNLNFSFFSKELNKEKYLQVITNALKKLGIDAYLSGRNDILVGDKKISGTAYLNDNGRYLFHGTLMVDVNLHQLEKALHPNYLKFEGKGIASVRGRVTNIIDINDQLTIDIIKKAIIEEYINMCPDTHVSTWKTNRDVVKSLISKDWIYNDEHKNDIQVEKRIKNAIITLSIHIENNIMTDIHVFTDSLDINLKEQLISNLKNQPYDKLDYLIEKV